MNGWLHYLRFETGVMKPGQSFDDYILWDEYRENILFRKFDRILGPPDAVLLRQFDVLSETELREEQEEILFRRFYPPSEMVDPGVVWTVHDLSLYVLEREAM